MSDVGRCNHEGPFALMKRHRVTKTDKAQRICELEKSVLHARKKSLVALLDINGVGLAQPQVAFCFSDCRTEQRSRQASFARRLHDTIC
jgi:hypothetical protein